TAEERYAANCHLLTVHPHEGWHDFPTALKNVPLAGIQLVPNGKGQLIGALWNPTTQSWLGMSNFEDPEAEAKRDAEMVWSPQAKIFTIFGLGLGYVAAALAKRLRPYQRMSVWELMPVVFKGMLHAVDVAPLLQPNVQLFVGPQIL